MIQIPVPDHIQAMLVDDWENITKNNQLVPLPHPKPVNKILDEYLKYEAENRQPDSSSMDILEEVIAGLREYFEKALSRILLYRLVQRLFPRLDYFILMTISRFERHQYIDSRKLWEKQDADAEKTYHNVGDVYGAEHLARLLGKPITLITTILRITNS